MATVNDLTRYLESIAPLAYQESYDNAGLLVGDPEQAVTGVIVCLDATEAVLDDALQRNCNVVVAHHPIIFKGLKSLTGRHYVERVVIKAIRHRLAIYAIHTNLDNVLRGGVNQTFAERLGLQNLRILAPKAQGVKLSSFVPALHQDKVEKELLRAGADQVAFLGQTSYAKAPIDNGNVLDEGYVKVEALLPSARQGAVLRALRARQTDRQVQTEIVAVQTPHPDIGSGMVGECPAPLEEEAFLDLLRERMGTPCVRHTATRGRPVRRVALCGGAGIFLLSDALRAGADAYVTADVKYHEFFEADGKLLLADIGHYESEQFTIDRLQALISDKFRTFAAHCTRVNTNPVHYRR